MTTRIATDGPTPLIQATPTQPRVTPTPARPFSNVFAASARAVISSAESATRSLPGGAVLAAALRAPAQPAGGQLAPEGATTATDPLSLPAGTAGLEPSLEGMADRNLYYLQLQERISAESREYTALSNVLKAQHDTMKNAISNLR